MKTETIKETIFKKGVKAIPNAVWVVCASYTLIVISTVLALSFSHIDADKHINRYFDIVLSKQELDIDSNNETNRDIEMLYTLIAKNNNEIEELKKDSHPPTK